MKQSGLGLLLLARRGAVLTDTSEKTTVSDASASCEQTASPTSIGP